MFLQAAFLGVGRALCIIFCLHEWVCLWEMEGGVHEWGYLWGVGAGWGGVAGNETKNLTHALSHMLGVKSSISLFQVLLSSLSTVHAFRS